MISGVGGFAASADVCQRDDAPKETFTRFQLLLGWLVGWLVGWWVGWLVGWLVSFHREVCGMLEGRFVERKMKKHSVITSSLIPSDAIEIDVSMIFKMFMDSPMNFQSWFWLADRKTGKQVPRNSHTLDARMGRQITKGLQGSESPEIMNMLGFGLSNNKTIKPRLY